MVRTRPARRTREEAEMKVPALCRGRVRERLGNWLEGIVGRRDERGEGYKSSCSFLTRSKAHWLQRSTMKRNG